MNPLPQTAYADAVHAALAAGGVAPDVTEVAVTETSRGRTELPVRDLTITCRWDDGTHLVWAHAHGWSLHRTNRDETGQRALHLPPMADPAALVPLVRAALAGQSGTQPPGRPVLWAGHLTLDRELADWEDRPAP